MKKNIFSLLFLFVFLFLSSPAIPNDNLSEEVQELKNKKLYWFLPDGMRADPDIFTVFQWAQEGYLPNIKKMMDNGAYGYSIPTFPSHTPTNFATLFTGTYPEKHGVADGPMHVEGHPLNRVSVGGFNSAAKKIDPIWVTLEKKYDQEVSLLAVPGSTPPELDNGITIRGRWGGWGADFHAINFEEKKNNEAKIQQGRGSRLFFFGPHLTRYPESKEISETALPIQSFSPMKEIEMEQYGVIVYAYIYDSTDNHRIDYNHIAFSLDRENLLVSLQKGQWSDWFPVALNWKVKNEQLPVDSFFKIKVIKLEEDGFYRVRFFNNNLNKFIAKPDYVADEIIKEVGPMVDFVDNFPPQLIYYPEDKTTFIEEAHMSLDWHQKAASYMIDKYNPDIMLHNIYTPNQMLTSRWWMGYIDSSSSRYQEVAEEQREQLWNEVKDMYKGLDDIVGELLNRADENTYIALSSDHGAVPLDKWVRLNNLFAKRGWLKFEIDSKTGEPIINWENSQVIYLKMAHVYISPGGLNGNWKRASGEEYEKLRKEVKDALMELKDQKTGIKPVIAVYNWEDAPEYLQLPTDRVGDLVIVNEAGYGWNEEMTQDLALFSTPLKTGYKQAVLADREKGMWTPFIIMGPGIKKGYVLKEPIQHIHQYPTIMNALGKQIPEIVDGQVLDEIFE